MVEKDIEYSIKNIILSKRNEAVTITNEFSSDGIVRYNGRAVGILEFKNKRNFENELTMAQIFTQAMCYYYKLITKENIDTSKPFYLVIGDDNEIALLNLHQVHNLWVTNNKWGTIAPSRAYKEPDLLEVASSILKLTPMVYYKYEDVKELSFGLKLLFSGLIH